MPPLFLIKLLLFLAMIIGIIYGGFLLARKRLLTHANHRSSIIVVEYKRIDQKLSVSLVKINDEYLVLASGPQGIALQKLENHHNFSVDLADRHQKIAQVSFH